MSRQRREVRVSVMSLLGCFVLHRFCAFARCVVWVVHLLVAVLERPWRWFSKESCMMFAVTKRHLFILDVEIVFDCCLM